MRRSILVLLFVIGGCAAAIGAATPPIAPIPSDEYVFVRDTDSHVAFERGDFLYIGKLDAAGNFEQEFRYARGAPRSSSYKLRFIVIPALEPKKAYEFRSGMLVKGEIMPEGNFIPEAGSKVIPFADYKYSPEAIPIWNLPGYFRKTEKLAAVKDGKK